MSGSLKSVLQKQYKAAFARWPKDQLRPDVQLPDVLGRHLGERLAAPHIGFSRAVGAAAVTGKAATPATTATPAPPTDNSNSDLAQLRQVNALYALLDNRYKTAYRLDGGAASLLAPKSNPTYYRDLMTELEEAPKRSFLGRLGKRLGGMFRLS